MSPIMPRRIYQPDSDRVDGVRRCYRQGCGERRDGSRWGTISLENHPLSAGHRHTVAWFHANQPRPEDQPVFITAPLLGSFGIAQSSTLPESKMARGTTCYPPSSTGLQPTPRSREDRSGGREDARHQECHAGSHEPQLELLFRPLLGAFYYYPPACTLA